MCSGRGVSGRRCRRTCRRAAPSGSTSTCGTRTGRWSASTTRSMLRCGRTRAARRARRRLGRKRHVLTDTIGLLLAVHVHPASVQDHDGAEALLREARRSFPFIERIIGDAGYQGQKMQAAVARTGSWELQIVRRCDRHRFVVLPKRWIVERTLAWISRCRRLARDYERHARKAAAFVRLAMIRLMLRRLA